MALIKCNKCGKDISDSVKKCPHCGFDLKEKENKKKNKIIIISVLVAILLITILIMIVQGIKESKYKLSDDNSYEVYEILKDHQNDFKNPSSVRVKKAFVCNNVWNIEIEAKNGYGNTITATFLKVDNLFFDMNNISDYCDTNEKRIKAINFLLEQEDCIKEGKSIYVNEKDITAINNRLERDNKTN